MSDFFQKDECNPNDFKEFLSRKTHGNQVSHAASVEKNIPCYDCPDLLSQLSNPQNRQALMGEWANILMNGAGVIVLKNAYADTTIIDRATLVFKQIIEDECATNSGGDHFAKEGANDRIWNALQKLCEYAPETFVDYHSNPFVTAVSEAWLGPNYQMTAQINLVRPGGQAQLAHRDYHLGFQTPEHASKYPAHQHVLSQALTLQGGIAHCDMPIDSGPTKLLPFSQLYEPGYVAFTRPDFREIFEENCVQLPLAKGDLLFFNPALFHGAGTNNTENIERMVNLLQVSSAFGRAMESIDRDKMSKLIYPVLLEKLKLKAITQVEANAAIASCAEGYPFPTNLDTYPPIGGLAPQSQQELIRHALESELSCDEFAVALASQNNKRRP